MKCLVPFMAFALGGLTVFGICTYTQNKSEVKKLIKTMTNFKDTVTEQVKDIVTNK